MRDTRLTHYIVAWHEHGSHKDLNFWSLPLALEAAASLAKEHRAEVDIYEVTRIVTLDAKGCPIQEIPPEDDPPF
jgi:hypothetical protein